MKRIKKGDIVGRLSYNKDIFFIVKDIRDKKNVLLEGVFVRIIADSDISVRRSIMLLLFQQLF